MSDSKDRSMPPRGKRAVPERAQAHAAGAAHDARSAASPVPRSIDSATLLAGADELHITHGDACYRLKRTALGKLILTK